MHSQVSVLPYDPAGHSSTHSSLLGSANRRSVPGQSGTHLLVEGSANRVGHCLRHSEVSLYAKNPGGQVDTHKLEVSSAQESARDSQLG